MSKNCPTCWKAGYNEGLFTGRAEAVQECQRLKDDPGNNEDDRQSCEACIDAINALLGAAQGSEPWVSVDVRLPRSAKDEYVQVYSKAGFQNTLQTSEFRNQLDYARQECMWTHWKPLGPNPDAAPAPQGEKADQDLADTMNSLAHTGVEETAKKLQTPIPGAQAGLTRERIDFMQRLLMGAIAGMEYLQCEDGEETKRIIWLDLRTLCSMARRALPVESGEAKP